MDYSLVAGSLVTLSLFFLFIETRVKSSHATLSTSFIWVYGLGVVCWLVLGILMNHAALVAISALQILFLALYWSEGVQSNE